jgi:3-deoxy-D-manno-octulosonic acid kinase
MQVVTTAADGGAILYDAAVLGKIDASFFDPAAWRARGRLTGEARGRGTTWFVRHAGGELALRHYRRGGLLGPWLGDRYLWLGLARSRAFREWHLLATLHARGLPVPQPVAARVRRRGLCYTADLLTRRLPATESLAERLRREPLGRRDWDAIGACLARFHAAGVWHADLNAHNVLLGRGRVFLLDFDRGRLRAPGSWRLDNLARLKRSLEKLARAAGRFHFVAADWAALLAGYEAELSSGSSSSSAAR